MEKWKVKQKGRDENATEGKKNGIKTKWPIDAAIKRNNYHRRRESRFAFDKRRVVTCIMLSKNPATIARKIQRKGKKRANCFALISQEISNGSSSIIIRTWGAVNARYDLEQGLLLNEQVIPLFFSGKLSKPTENQDCITFFSACCEFIVNIVVGTCNNKLFISLSWQVGFKLSLYFFQL